MLPPFVRRGLAILAGSLLAAFGLSAWIALETGAWPDRFAGILSNALFLAMIVAFFLSAGTVSQGHYRSPVRRIQKMLNPDYQALAFGILAGLLFLVLAALVTLTQLGTFVVETLIVGFAVISAADYAVTRVRQT